MYMFESKKAISPLIATVFLIAFAVAIGVMIMNWTPAEPTMKEIYSKNCNDIRIQLTKVPCIDSDNNLVLNIKNNGLNKFDGIMVKARTDIEDSVRTLKGSSLVPTEQFTKLIQFGYNGGTIEMRIVPLVLEKNSFVECTKSEVYVSSLPKC